MSSTGHQRVSLPELRRKTDRQLLALARNEVDRSLAFAKQGARAEAEASSAQARTLLFLINASQEVSELEIRLDEVTAMLQQECAAAAHSAWF